eukprot:Phypoly_transcript_05596.p2 GENE.Phypoly_transcript_05596~~Phypoly_transcript_05596.p2  ORF type:complete len:180 (+),score=31.34 Phypoly_transcript_05596:61-540(+)
MGPPSLLFPLFLFLVFSGCALADIPFDLTQEQYCLQSNGGCSFTNSSIWVGGVVPSGIDAHANITGNNNYSSPLLIYIESSDPNNPIIVGGLFVHNAQFQIRTNATLQVGFITIHDFGALTLQALSYTTTLNQNPYPNPSIMIASTSTLTVEDGSTLIC